MPLSIMNAEYFRQNARREALFRGSVAGKASLNFHKRLFREAEDPRRPFLTDVGFLDIRQGERHRFWRPVEIQTHGGERANRHHGHPKEYR